MVNRVKEEQVQVGCVLCGSLCLFFRQEEYVSGKIGIPGIGDGILIMVNGMVFPCLFILLFPAGDLCGIGKMPSVFRRSIPSRVASFTSRKSSWDAQNWEMIRALS